MEKEEEKESELVKECVPLDVQGKMRAAASLNEQPELVGIYPRSVWLELLCVIPCVPIS